MTNSAHKGDRCPICGKKLVGVTDDKRSLICKRGHHVINLDGPVFKGYEAPPMQGDRA